MPGQATAFDDAVEARPFRTGDEPGVLELLRVCFGRWPCDIEGVTPGEFFRWKHVDGAFGASTLVVAEAHGAIVGFIAYLPWRLKARGRVVSTMRGVDFAVHPSYRRRGVSMAMRAAAHFPGDAAFTWSNPNEQSRPGGLSWGQREVSKMPQFVRPAGRTRVTLQRASAKGAKTPPRARVEADTAGELLRDRACASLPLAGRKDHDDRLRTDRSLGYLRWRYGRFLEYRAIRADAGEATGIVIFRTRRHGPFWVSHICELFAEHDDRRTLRQMIGRVRDAAPTDFLSCSFSSRSSAALCGFLPHRSPKTVMVYPLQPQLSPDPARRSSWELSLGDLELL